MPGEPRTIFASVASDMPEDLDLFRRFCLDLGVSAKPREVGAREVFFKEMTEVFAMNHVQPHERKAAG